MKNFKEIAVAGIVFLVTSSILHAFEDANRTSSPVTTPSKTNPSALNPSGKEAASQSSTQNIPSQNAAQQNTPSSSPTSTVTPSSSATLNNYKAQAPSTANPRRPKPSYKMVAEADVRTHSGASLDDDIIQKIRWGVKNDKTISDKGKSIQVAVTKGEVTLIGNVATQSEKNKIESLVKQIDGVQRINSKLSISSK
ncbi:BON domain-containing protein [Parachlamydia sp. AcF125]|uniref:BON domain-containing protein n=1 Tax=Parachlamydia sp. AcF125 TaxID=2795736 RepID=UPI001BC8E531|nr:BON domain-containing protein [Parachlamydia sp. AcF125]MBS4168539.1 hypothetical protein [Parachlamydia sp. AcF125]